jgi:ribosomal protein S18 acetylase RimI-like enzyme
VAPELKPTIRDAAAADHSVVQQLYESGALGGPTLARIADDASDIDNMAHYYLTGAGPRLWVAELPAIGVVGMVAVSPIEQDVAEMRRLRVFPEYQGKGVGRALVQHAIAYCRDNDFLKVVLDTFVERSGAIGMFEKFGFKLARTKLVGDRERLDFFMDLYRDINHDSKP